jgi:hypothetical protein
MFSTIKKVRAQIILAIYSRENNADFEYIRNKLLILILFFIVLDNYNTHYISAIFSRKQGWMEVYTTGIFILIFLFLPRKIATTHFIKFDFKIFYSQNSQNTHHFSSTFWRIYCRVRVNTLCIFILTLLCCTFKIANTSIYLAKIFTEKNGELK